VPVRGSQKGWTLRKSDRAGVAKKNFNVEFSKRFGGGEKSKKKRKSLWQYLLMGSQAGP